MSAPIPVLSKTGTINQRHITTEGDHHHHYTWNIRNFSSFVDGGRKLQSPEFTVPSRDGCKWYLSLESIYSGTEKTFVAYFLRLILDRTSDCKAAVAKFKLYRSDDQQGQHPWRTFRFAPKSENSTGLLFSFDNKTRQTRGYYCDSRTMVCEIIIESITLEDGIFLRDFESLLKTQQLTDFVISVGERNFPVHKAILIAHSSVFSAMFAHNTTENRGGLHIKDMNEEVVEEMIRYIYTGEVENLNDLAQDLLKAADKYDLKGLRIKCEEILIESLSNSNALDLLLLAVTYNSSDLKFEAFNFMRMKAENLMKTSAWESLCQSNPEVIREIAEAFIFPGLAGEAK